MSERREREGDARRSPRLKLPPMYTLIRVRTEGSRRYRWAGHIYDISDCGMRFELDAALKPGTCIEARVTLPGGEATTIGVVGRVVRLHDDEDERGPMRMGMTIERFSHTADRARLRNYLQGKGLQAA